MPDGKIPIVGRSWEQVRAAKPMRGILRYEGNSPAYRGFPVNSHCFYGFLLFLILLDHRVAFSSWHPQAFFPSAFNKGLSNFFSNKSTLDLRGKVTINSLRKSQT